MRRASPHPVSFVFAGGGHEADGSEVFPDTTRMDTSLDPGDLIIVPR